MTKFQDEFRALVADYLVDQGKQPQEIEAGDDYLLNAQDRILQLRLGMGGAMLLSTMIFYNDGDTVQVLNGPIAEFNAYHLFAGGYCLHVDAASGSVYVEQELTTGRFDAGSLRQHLLDFADRATSCARWYLDQSREQSAAGTSGDVIIA
ncbi:hypothetical protein WNZ15_19585 [Roseibium sp. AS2]|uniref:hypothetical protein n=1 Tax=Roseibium sp. AS2 TaxID=3135781 RepID=UPI003177E497